MSDPRPTAAKHNNPGLGSGRPGCTARLKGVTYFTSLGSPHCEMETHNSPLSGDHAWRPGARSPCGLHLTHSRGEAELWASVVTLYVFIVDAKPSLSQLSTSRQKGWFLAQRRLRRGGLVAQKQPWAVPSLVLLHSLTCCRTSGTISRETQLIFHSSGPFLWGC